MPFLTLQGRRETIDAILEQFPKAELGIASSDLARISNGLSRRTLVQLIREAILKGEKKIVPFSGTISYFPPRWTQLFTRG